MTQEKFDNIEGCLEFDFAGKKRKFKLTFKNLSNIENRLGLPVMKIVNGFGVGDIGINNVTVILHEGLMGAGGKYTYEAVGNMALQHGFSNCLTIVSDILLKSMGLQEASDNPLEQEENQDQ